MAIIETINDSSYFWQWLQKSDNYKNNFSYEGAKAVQEYFEQLSDDTGENIEFDPVAWCCECSEYEDVTEAYKDFEGYGVDPEDYPKWQDQLQYFEDNTQVVSVEPFVIASF